MYSSFCAQMQMSTPSASVHKLGLRGIRMYIFNPIKVAFKSANFNIDLCGECWLQMIIKSPNCLLKLQGTLIKLNRIGQHELHILYGG